MKNGFWSGWKLGKYLALGVTMLALSCLPANRKSSHSGQVNAEKSSTPPEENRFVKTVLINDLNEPMDLSVLADGNIFFAERKGKIWYYNAREKKSTLVRELPVQINKGFGLLGLTTDPDFLKNHFIYIFYSPLKETYKHYISRFTVKEDHLLDLNSEKILLQFAADMEPSFHHGGSLAFDQNKNLVIATGDNTGAGPYAPLDLRPDRVTYDAQRSAANSNDLRGKILRIHPETDGTYTIPDGNLFSKNTPNTRPEIYVMGLRNPYRLAVHPKTGTVYWGEVGPDAGRDGKEGPRGHDEFNQAKKAGYFGWPYFIGNNKPYNAKDFATGQIGGAFDVAAPVNNSPNNTGIKALPAPQKALIWYPYAVSEEFPLLGEGGRCAIAGPVYGFEKNKKSLVAFPAYYHNAWFIFDWMRNWAMAVHFDENENLTRMEPFLPETGDFRRPVDAAFGADGALYMLEYGSIYGIDNDDARLVKIEYNGGNRAPIAEVTVSDSVGHAPFTLNFSAEKSRDSDAGDELKYEWFFEKNKPAATSSNASFTYSKNGKYQAILKVTDRKGAADFDTIVINVGNTRPEIGIELVGNQTFYWQDAPLKYQVKVSDAEDQQNGFVQTKIYLDYQARPSKNPSKTNVLTDLETSSAGEILIASSDCKACHMLDKTVVGPSFKDIAERYKGDGSAVEKLFKKIINGGSGAWGEHSMAAHPQLSEKDAAEMAKYILTINEGKKARKSLPANGTIDFDEHNEADNAIFGLNGWDQPTLTGHGTYRFIATYTDKGGNGTDALTTTEVRTFRHPRMSGLEADQTFDINNWKNVLRGINNGSWLLYKNIDLADISLVTYSLSSKDHAAQIELHLDSPDGPLVSTAPFPVTGDWNKKTEVSAKIDPTRGKHDLYFVIKKQEAPFKNLLILDWIQFDRSPAQTAGTE